MYDGYGYLVHEDETDPLVRFHFICAQIYGKCREMHITERLSLPNGMTIIPSYVPAMGDDGMLKGIEVIFNLEIHGILLGRIRDIICAFDSFAIDMGYIIIGSGLPYSSVYYLERDLPLAVEILKLVDSVSIDVWPAWYKKYPLKRGYKGPLLGWDNDPLYTINGIRKTVFGWSEVMGVNPLLVQREMDDGAEIADALKEASIIHPSRPPNRYPSTHHPRNRKMYCYEGR